MANPKTLGSQPSDDRPRRGRPPDPEKIAANRGRMVEAAFNLFADAGYDQTTVEHIATGAGQTKGAFYWYFTDKADCLRKALEEKARFLEEAVTEVVQQQDTAYERLLLLARVDGWRDREFVRMVSLLNHLHYQASPAIRVAGQEIKAGWIMNASRALRKLGRKAAQERGWDQGRIAEFDFDVWSLCWIASMEGLLLQTRHDAKDAPDAGRVAGAINRLFLGPFARRSSEAGSADY